jgi:hypothetical protein
MNGTHKLLKYLTKYSEEAEIKKKSLYFDKIDLYLGQLKLIDRHQLTGGGGETIELGNLDSLLNFLRSSVSSAKSSKNKYFVVLYGAPGSGKHFARSLSCHLLRSYFGDSEVDLSTFVDTGIDEITYRVGTGGRSVLEMLRDNTRVVLSGDETVESAKRNIDALVRSSREIYLRYRQDYLSEILLYFAAFLSKNIFMEVASPSQKYLVNLLDGFCHFYGYIPVIVYPFIGDMDMLYGRVLDRGLREGRFIACDGPYGLKAKSQEILDTYLQLRRKLRGNGADHLMAMYDANFDRDRLVSGDKLDSGYWDSLLMDLSLKSGPRAEQQEASRDRLSFTDCSP